MSIYFTSRQIPELRHLSAEQVRDVEQHCLDHSFRRHIWLLVLLAVPLGYLGSTMGVHLADGVMGGRVIGICIAAALAAVLYTHIVCSRARPRIREYLAAQNHDRDTQATS